MDSQVACLLDRVLATCHLQYYRFWQPRSKGEKTNLIPVPLGLTKHCELVCAFCHNLASLVFIPDKKEIADYSGVYRLWFAIGSFCYARLSKHE